MKKLKNSDPLLTMYLTFSGNKKKDAQQIAAIPTIAKTFKTVIMTALSWYEWPDLDEHAIGEALQLAEDHGLKRILHRKVTPTWKGLMTREWRSQWPRFTDPRIFREDSFIATAIARVRAEAKNYGASSGLYWEPHSRLLNTWKRNPVLTRERRAIASACARAVSVAGSVDFISPWGSRSDTHFSYAFGNSVASSGQILGTGTYYLKNGEYYENTRHVLPNISPGFSVLPFYSPKPKHWSPKLVMEWIRSGGWTEYLKLHPKAEGLWIYPSVYVGPVAKLFAEFDG